MGLPAIPTVAQALGNLLGIALTIKQLMGEDDQTQAARLKYLTDRADGAAFTLADLNELLTLTKADTANTLAHVTEHLPVEDGTGGGGGGGDDLMAETWRLYGYMPYPNNPDFAIAYRVPGTTLPVSVHTQLWALKPRNRPAGQSVVDYLTANSEPGTSPGAGDYGAWIAVGNAVQRVVRDPVSGAQAGHLICLLPAEAVPAPPPPDHTGTLAEIRTDVDVLVDRTVQTAGADQVILDQLPDARIDTLLSRTQDTPAADDKILGTDFTPAPAPDPWAAEVGISPITGLGMTAGELLRAAGHQSWQRYQQGIRPLSINPQFAMDYFQPDAYLVTGLSDLAALDPLGRPRGESVGAYLAREAAGRTWAAVGPHWVTDVPLNGPINVSVRVICLVTDSQRIHPPAGVVGDPIALGRSGDLDITGAIGVIVTLTDIPDYIGRVDVDPPERYELRLGNIAFGGYGGVGPTMPLEYPVTHVAVTLDDITILRYHIREPISATVQLVTAPGG